MATANGAATSPAVSTTRPDIDATSNGVKGHKRKRDDDGSEAATDATSPAQTRNARIQRDILDVLSKYDTDPPCLDHPLDRNHEPSVKKVRLSKASDASNTISAKLQQGAYSSLDGLKSDVGRIVEDQVRSVRSAAKDREAQDGGRLTVDDLKRIQRLHAFEKLVGDVVEREVKYEEARNHAATSKVEGLPNGHHAGGASATQIPRHTVLTLFGNAPTPRQLFSSMQITPAARDGAAINTELPVEEMSLPNGLTATNVMSVPTDEGKKKRTLGDAFPPPYNLAALQPPKSHRRSTTRDAIIPWEFKDPLLRTNKKGGYTTQTMTVSDWLDYGGVDSKDDAASPRERRKQRDRALSAGEGTRPPQNQPALDEAMAKEEEMLLRRAYSSFAPTCDNTNALVPEETKNMLWWYKLGEKKFDETFALDPALVQPVPAADYATTGGQADDWISDDFSQVLDDYAALEDDLSDGSAQPVQDKTDVDQILRDISNLLETLASHQQIRNASLSSSTAAARTPISPAPSLSSRIGRPDSPAEDEIAVYSALKREIAYLVLKLPPYAVAKLQGDQLSELVVSRMLTFENKDVSGTTEEDSVARLARHTAMATAAGIASLTRSQSSSSGQHYSSTNQRAPAIGQAANTRYGQQYASSRTQGAASSFQRYASNASSYGTPVSTGSRSNYTATGSQYGRSSILQQGYNQPNGQQYYQRPAQSTGGGYAGYPQQHQSSTPSQQRTYSSSQPLAQFQRAAQNAVAYQPGAAAQSPSSLNRTLSPIKPTTYNSSSYQQPPVHRSSFSSSQHYAGSDRASTLTPQPKVNGYQGPLSRPAITPTPPAHGTISKPPPPPQSQQT